MEGKKKILVVKLIAAENRKNESSNSSVWDELKFEVINLFCLGWIRETGREHNK